jgi:hypothetical protein
VFLGTWFSIYHETYLSEETQCNPMPMSMARVCIAPSINLQHSILTQSTFNNPRRGSWPSLSLPIYTANDRNNQERGCSTSHFPIPLSRKTLVTIIASFLIISSYQVSFFDLLPLHVELQLQLRGLRLLGTGIVLSTRPNSARPQPSRPSSTSLPSP